MTGEWIFQVALVLIPVLVSSIFAYLLGLRRQKTQVLREYITGIVEDTYPSLFSEMKRNSEVLDNYLENPNENFDFPELEEIYSSGLEEFMKTHHKDLFLMVDSFQKKILPKFYELDTLTGELIPKIFVLWVKHLRASLPKEVVELSESIALDLKSVGSYYVIPDLLNQRCAEAKNKIEKYFLSRPSHIHRKEEQMRHFLTTSEINVDEISQSLIEKAKPEIANLVKRYRELKKQNDKEVKENLLPLLQKYISKPV